MEFGNFIIHPVEGRRAQRYNVNYMDHQKSFIQAEEVLMKVNKEWLHFTSPHRVIQANTLHDVIPTLREIEDQVQINGWHAAGFISYEALPHSIPHIKPGRERDSHICGLDSTPHPASFFSPKLIH